VKVRPYLRGEIAEIHHPSELDEVVGEYGDGTVSMMGWACYDEKDGTIEFWADYHHEEAIKLQGESHQLQKDFEKIAAYHRDLVAARLQPAWETLPQGTKAILERAGTLEAWLYPAPSEVSRVPMLVYYSHALESYLRERFFEPFRRSSWSTSLPEVEGLTEHQERSLRLLKFFCGGDDSSLTIKSMAYILQNVGCELRQREENGFARFLEEQLEDLHAFCSPQVYDYDKEWRENPLYDSADLDPPRRMTISKRLVEFVDEFRNPAVHLTKNRPKGGFTAFHYLRDLLRDIEAQFEES